MPNAIREIWGSSIKLLKVARCSTGSTMIRARGCFDCSTNLSRSRLVGEGMRQLGLVAKHRKRKKWRAGCGCDRVGHWTLGGGDVSTLQRPELGKIEGRG